MLTPRDKAIIQDRVRDAWLAGYKLDELLSRDTSNITVSRQNIRLTIMEAYLDCEAKRIFGPETKVTFI